MIVDPFTLTPFIDVNPRALTPFIRKDVPCLFDRLDHPVTSRDTCWLVRSLPRHAAKFPTRYGVHSVTSRSTRIQRALVSTPTKSANSTDGRLAGQPSTFQGMSSRTARPSRSRQATSPIKTAFLPYSNIYSEFNSTDKSFALRGQRSGVRSCPK